MLFNSLTFAVFLVITFTIYWLMGSRPGRLRMQNFFILTVSYIFYGWWSWKFLSLIFISSLVDFIAGMQLEKLQDQRKRRAWLALSLTTNLGLLAVFKYFDFFTATFASAMARLGWEVDALTLDLILPVGISFYTFQTLSYTLDVYFRKIPATRNPIDFFAFVSFFPQLVAGPIERAAHLLPQFRKPRKFDYYFAITGLRLILWGMFKKVVIADRLGEYADAIFSHPSDYQGLSIVLGAIFFAIQIYCDFSGYSDIAIGTARLFGFDIFANFRTPYLARSLREFWERWHISLSTWFRDYLYIPLGGNRVGEFRWIFNIMAVFLISGLWHGANLTFVIWGGIHGIAYIIEEKAGFYKWMPVIFRQMWTLIIVVSAWIFFRADDLHVAGQMFLQLFKPDGGASVITGYASELNFFMSDRMELFYLVFLIAVLIAVNIWQGKRDFSETVRGIPGLIRWMIYYLLIAWLLMLKPYGEPEQFIYFQF